MYIYMKEERLVLVHIPLELYPYFFKSVLRLIYDEVSPLEEDSDQNDHSDTEEDHDEDDSVKGDDQQPAFLNVSITPVEVSVICSRRLVDKYFGPSLKDLEELDKELRSRLVISENDYVAMQVLGQGLEAGKRVLELTSPLAMAGMYVEDIYSVPLAPPT